jgi:hypothetical protein
MRRPQALEVVGVAGPMIDDRLIVLLGHGITIYSSRER